MARVGPRRIVMRALLFALVALLAVLVAPSRAQDEALARVKAQPVLGKLDYVRNLEHPPFELLYHRPGKDYGDGFEAAMAKEHGPWLRAIAENFDADYAQPNGLRRRLDRPMSLVVVLWMLKDYQPWLKDQPEPNGFSELALYDPALGATVTAEYGVPVQAPHWKRMPMLAQAVRGELDAHARDGNVRLPHWVAEGLSSYLASHEWPEPTSLRKHFLDKQLVEKVVLTMHDPGVRNSTLLPLRELFAVTSYPATRAALVKKYGPAVEKLIKPELAMKMVHGQSWALVMYLHEGAGGKYRAGFVKYLGSALAGDGSLAAFQKALPGVDVGALEAEFYAWLFELYGTMFPGRKADPLALKGLGTPAGAAGAQTDGSKPIDLAAALELDVPSAHAGLLFEIRRGRFESSIAELEKLRARPKVGAHAARLETEILRCRKFIALRDKHVGALAAAGGKLAFEHEGKKQSAKVKGMADGKVFLEENRAKLAALPLEALDPLGEQHQRRPGLPTRQADERDLEHEPGVGGVDAPHVDHGLAEGLDDPDEHRVAQRVADGAQRLGLLRRAVDRDPPGAGVQEECVTGRSQQVVGDPPGRVAGLEQRAELDQDQRGLLIGDGLQDPQAQLERRAPEQRRGGVGLEPARGVGEGLVEQ